MMYMILAIAAGGALGAVCRYGFNHAAVTFIGGEFPIGIMLANIFGSFLMGAVAAYALTHGLSDILKAFLIVGVLGAFTTFSAFSLDSFHLYEKGDFFGLGLYVFGSVLLSFVGLYTGMVCVKCVLPG